MPLTQLSSPPDPSSWKKLDEHQASTPSTFSEIVLHLSTKGAQLLVSSDQKELLPGFFDEDKETVTNGEKKEESAATAAINGSAEKKEGEEEDEDSEEDVKDLILDGVEVHVVSDKLIIYLPTRTSGVEVPYPQITLHAITTTTVPSSTSRRFDTFTETPIKKQAIYMQIDPHGAQNTYDDHDVDCLEITIIPSSDTTVEELYAALTDCSNLHPEPTNDWGGIGNDEDEEGNKVYFEHMGEGMGVGLGGGGISFLGGADEVGGIPALAPGGWITAENADSITWTDEDGKTGVGLASFGSDGAVGEGAGVGLGPGAGTVRNRDDVQKTEKGQFDDAEEDGAAEGGEAKWRRTD